MPTCAQCGENDFDCIDGSYYCTLCQTQSQDVRVEEGEDFVDVGAYAKDVGASTKPKSETKQKDLGRLWTTHEGFQFIIKEQVNCLIKLGASKDIRECIWRLWVMYLSKLGVAFTNNTELSKNAPVLMYHPRRRDIKPGTADCPKVKTFMRKKASQIKTKTINTEELASEEFYKGDNPDSESVDSETEDEMFLVDENPETRHCRSNIEKAKAKTNYFKSAVHVSRMNIQKTLAFCYLGLLYTRSLSGPGDLTRWVRHGKVPYWSGITLLPEELKLNTTDIFTLNTSTMPNTKMIRQSAYNIVKLLDIEDSLPVPDICLLIHRYILSLQLPGEMHGLAMNLLQSKPPNINPLRKGNDLWINNYDAVAMSYIITTLKLLLGLDDSTERKLSVYARRLMKMVNLKQPLFVWEDWHQYIEKREIQKEEFSLVANHNQLREIRDIKPFTTSLEKLSSLYGGKPTLQRYPTTGTWPQVRSSIQQCFASLGEKWTERNVHQTDSAFKSQSGSYDPSVTSTLMDQDPIGFLVDSPTKKTTNEKVSKSKDDTETDFRKTTLRFITQQENFLEELDRQGLSDFTIHSSCISSSDSESDVPEHNDSDDLFGGLRLEDKIIPKARKSRNRKRKRAKQAVLTALSGKPTNSKPGKSLNKNDLMENFERAYEQYKLYNRTSSESIRHQSYDWLLRLCAKTIDVPVEELDSYAQNIQYIYISDGEGMERYSKLRMAKFFHKYFNVKS